MCGMYREDTNWDSDSRLDKLWSAWWVSSGSIRATRDSSVKVYVAVCQAQRALFSTFLTEHPNATVETIYAHLARKESAGKLAGILNGI